jgi:aldose sugar dehydrogenase
LKVEQNITKYDKPKKYIQSKFVMSMANLLCNKEFLLKQFAVKILCSRPHILFFIATLLILKLGSAVIYFNDFVYALSAQTKLVNRPIINDPDLEVEEVYKGINFPAGMAFMGSHDILVIEKNTGKIKMIRNNESLNYLQVNVANESERGLLGIDIINTMDQDNKDKREPLNAGNAPYVFVYYTESQKEDGGNVINNGQYNVTKDDDLRNRLYRYELDLNNLRNPKLLFDVPAAPGRFHQGGQVLIGPDNNVYLGIGDYNEPKLKTANNEKGSEPDGRGGILRITQNGDALTGNGILGDSYPLSLYYAYGIRNSFGMDFDPMTGNLWETENGPGFGDEINLVEPGFNSGSKKVQGVWKVIGYNCCGDTVLDPNDLIDFDGKGMYSSPEFTWNQTVGVTALKFLPSDKYGKEYENDMFIGDFMGGNIYHFDLTMDRTSLSLNGPLKDKIANEPKEVESAIFGRGFGGITDIEVGPDGYLYILSINHHGGNDCDPSGKNEGPDCISFSGSAEGTIFRVVPRQ